jgi:hypothetical protein
MLPSIVTFVGLQDTLTIESHGAKTKSEPEFCVPPDIIPPKQLGPPPSNTGGAPTDCIYGLIVLFVTGE